MTGTEVWVNRDHPTSSLLQWNFCCFFLWLYIQCIILDIRNVRNPIEITTFVAQLLHSSTNSKSSLMRLRAFLSVPHCSWNFVEPQVPATCAVYHTWNFFFSQKPCRTSTIYDLILQVYTAGGMSSRSECSKREPLLRSEASMDHTHVVVNKNKTLSKGRDLLFP